MSVTVPQEKSVYERHESQEEEARGPSDWDVGLTSVEEQGKEKDGPANVSPESLLEKVSTRTMGAARPKTCNKRSLQPGRNVPALVALLWLVMDPGNPIGTNHIVDATKSLK